jgi:hypothetical protein
MENEIYNNAVDNQTEEEKSLNYKFEEVCQGSAIPIFEERPYVNVLKQRYQNGSTSCVNQTQAHEVFKILHQKYGNEVEVSASYPFQKRNNPNIGGCSSVDIYEIFPKLGNVLECLMPSQNMGDTEMMKIPCLNFMVDLAKVYNFKRIALPLDFDTVVATMQQTGKCVMLWFHFTGKEWYREIPIVLNEDPTGGHSVAGFDAIKENGKDYITVAETYKPETADKNGVRKISREYFNARCFLASYIMNFKLEEKTIEIPKFDGSIISAQKCFKYEGLFPLNINEVENWGNITRGACKKFQLRYNIAPALGNFGNLTRSKLLEIYS